MSLEATVYAVVFGVLIGVLGTLYIEFGWNFLHNPTPNGSKHTTTEDMASAMEDFDGGTYTIRLGENTELIANGERLQVKSCEIRVTEEITPLRGGGGVPMPRREASIEIDAQTFEDIDVVGVSE